MFALSEKRTRLRKNDPNQRAILNPTASDVLSQLFRRAKHKVDAISEG
jgi:hypothetical protein